MIDGERFRSIERLVRDAEQDGAETFGGGQEWEHVYHANGKYFSATVVGPVSPEMEIAQTERELIDSRLKMVS
jgi:acyl-CoA reductase-like NAD-dependent aldehyde dehydrogenase